MNYLSVENISKNFGEKILFQNITFGIAQGQKVALVAKNGTGKTTLLKLLAGFFSPDTGQVVFKKDIRVAFLDQEPDLNANLTIIEEIFASDLLTMQTVKSYELALLNPENYEALQDAISAMDALNAWDMEQKAQQILSELGIDDLHQSVAQLSGGQKKRVALAKLLIEEPDFIILDEPTNHLDLPMIEWLEQFLLKSHMTVLMVTHDRYFLELVCDEIIELDGGKLYHYKGNYAYFLEKKAEREESFQSSVDKANNLMRKELEWVRRMPKARGTKAKYRMDAFEDLKEKASQKLHTNQVQIELNPQRLGGKIMELHHVKKKFEQKTILADFSYIFKRKEKIGIIGKNGVGKSTLLNLLAGLEQVDGGKIVVGETVVLGYYHQKGMQLAEDKRVIEVIKDIAEIIPLAKGKKMTAAQLLERFLFEPPMHYQYVSKLSGGERKRLYLLTILMKNPNFLILDEPTNDLDLLTLNVLEDFLVDFEGCVLIVTHDRYFMDKLVDHLFVFEGEGVVTDFNGTYTDYLQVAKQKKQMLDKTVLPEKEAVFPEKSDAKKMTFNQKKEYESIEKELILLEKDKANLLELLSKEGNSSADITQFSIQLAQLEQKIDEKTTRWFELAAIL